MKHRSLIRVIGNALVVGVIANACAASSPQQPKPPSWQTLEPQLLAWQTKQAGKNLLDSLDGLVEIEQQIARAQPNGYSPQAIAFRRQAAKRWTEQLAAVALALPMTTGQFETELSLFVLANADKTNGPATLEAGFAPRLMRGRLAFCDGFVAAEPIGDVFDKTWARMNWIADLYTDNPHGVPQGILFAGLWEARLQWQHEVESEPYDEFRHAWGHLLTELLHNPVRRDSSLFQTFEKVMLLHGHYVSKFRQPAPLTEGFAQLLETIQELTTSDNERTAEYAGDAWWNAKRGIDLVWTREDRPIQRALLGAMSEECLDACQSLSPASRTIPAGVIASARHWQEIVHVAEQFESTSDAPFHSRLRHFEELLPNAYRFGGCYQAVLRLIARPLRRQFEQQARDLLVDGSTAMALMRWLEAEQLCDVESRQPVEDPPLRGPDSNFLTAVDVYCVCYNTQQLFAETQILTQSDLGKLLGCRLAHTIGADKRTTMAMIKTSLQAANLSPRELEARRWFHGLPATPQQRLSRRAAHPVTLAKMVAQVVDGLAAARMVIDQLQWRVESTTATKLPDNFHITRLQPVWSAYLNSYGSATMNELLLQPLFENNPEGLQIVIDAVPESMRAELRKAAGI